MRWSLATNATPRIHEWVALAKLGYKKIERSFDAAQSEHRWRVVDDGPPQAASAGTAPTRRTEFSNSFYEQRIWPQLESVLVAPFVGNGIANRNGELPLFSSLPVKEATMSRETGVDTSVLMRHLRNFGLHPMSPGVSETPKQPRPMRFPAALHALRTLTVSRIETMLGIEWQRWSPS